MERAAGTVSPVIRAGDEVVDYLRKAKAARLHKHRRVRFFFLSALWLLCRRTALRSVSSLGLGSQMSGGSRSNVSPRLTEIGICVFVDKVACRLVRLRFVVVRFEIVQNWVGYVLFLVLVGVSRFFVLTLPFLDHAVTCFAERSCTFRCCKECLISCFAVIYDFLSIIQETVDTSMPVAALIVVYCLRFRVITVNRRPGNPPLSTVST